MKLESIINQSAFCSIGCITKPDDINVLERFVLHNFPVVSKFPKVVIAHTKTDNITQEQLNEYNNIWIKHFRDKCIVMNRKNYGHTFGFVDLDKSVIFESKHMGYKWVWKSTNDVLITEKIFDVEMDDAEFFFLQAHGFTGIQSYYNLDVDLAVNSFKDNKYQYFFPQTNFFITNTRGDNLIDKKFFEERYNECINDPEYNTGGTQIQFKYMLAEAVLRDYVNRNFLICKHLINKESYKNLVKLIVDVRMGDSSHKNILFNECGICHYHYYESPVIQL